MSHTVEQQVAADHAARSLVGQKSLRVGSEHIRIPVPGLEHAPIHPVANGPTVSAQPSSPSTQRHSSTKSDKVELAAPKVEFVKEGDIVKQIQITCTCGEIIRVQCVYS